MFPTGNFSSLQDWFLYADVVTDNLFSTLLVGSIWIISFVYMKSDESNRTFDCAAYSSFFATLVSWTLFAAGVLANQKIIWICIAMLVLSIAFNYFAD